MKVSEYLRGCGYELTWEEILKSGRVRLISNTDIKIVTRDQDLPADSEVYVYDSPLASAYIAVKQIREAVELFYGWPGWPKEAADRWAELTGGMIPNRDNLKIFIDKIASGVAR